MKKGGLFFLLLWHLVVQGQHLFPIQAHRGARAYYPENSLYAFAQCVKEGGRILELDVVISRDGQIVVSHEPWLNPSICGQNKQLLKRKIPLYQLSYEEIKTYDCGSFGHPKFPEQEKRAVYKPLLEEVLQWANRIEQEIGEQLQLNIEIKTKKSWEKNGMPNYMILCDAVVALLQKYQRIDKDMLQSFDPRALNYLYKKTPTIALSYLVGNGLAMREQLKKVAMVPSYYSPNARFINKKAVQKAQEKGMKVIPWTVNDTLVFQRLLSFGVDGVISDNPQLLQKFLQGNQK